MNFDNTILGYHCNFNNKLIEFVENGKLCQSHDKYYLGNGMYYWENKNSLNFWKEKKIRDAKKESITDEIVCISAKIMFNEDECLDLTTMEHFEKISKLQELISKSYGEKLFLGDVINRLLSSENPNIRSLLGPIKVIKANLRYKNLQKGYEKSDIVNYSDRLKGNSFSVDVRTIYSVRCKNRLKFHELISKEVVS